MLRRATITLVILLAALSLTLTAQTAADFFDDSVLQEIRIRIHPNDWRTLRDRFLDDTYYACELTWRGLVASNIGIRSRGFGSRSGVKPGLRVDFDRYESNQEFLGLKSVVLRNNTQDPSMLRERLSMLLFRRMGLPASREAHARLYINDQYFGLYTIVESIDKAFLKHFYGENDGYLYEYRWAEAYRFEYRGTDLARYSPVPFQPQTHERDPNPAPLEAMIRAINQSSDADFVRAVSEYLDLKLFLAHVAVENFLAENDGFVGYEGANNFYLYRFLGKNLSQLIAWDKSETFGDDNHSILWNMDGNVLTRRSLAVPELRRAYLEALVKSALVAGGRGGWLEQELVREYEQVRSSALEDVIKPFNNEAFETEVAHMREFAQRRAESVLAQTASAGFQLAAAAPKLNLGGVVNAASNLAGPVAPGSLLSLYGQGLANDTAQASSLPLPNVLGGVSVSINGFAAPLLFVSPTQINLQAPWELVPGATPVTVLLEGVPGNTTIIELGPVSPAVFAVVHADFAPVSEERPARAGDVLIVFANGLGSVTEPVRTGHPAPTAPLAYSALVPSVRIDTGPAEVLFSGLTPGFVGLYQVNVRVPAGVTAGVRTTVALGVGGVEAPVVTIVTR